MNQVLKIILPIFLGALIGYFTNDLAIKMLFHPRKPVMIGKHQLPFTPGIIPKNQSRIARAVGDAISGQLFTADDLVGELKGSAAKEEIAKKIADALFDTEQSVHSLAQSAELDEIVALPAPEPPVVEQYVYAEDGLIEEEESEKAEPTGFSARIGDYVTEKIVSRVDALDLHTMIDDLVWEGVQDYRKNPMIAMFLNAAAIDQIVDKVESTLRAYIAGDGKTVIRNIVAEEAQKLADKPIREITAELNLDRSSVTAAISRVLDHFIGQFGASFSEKTDISGIVREKIEAMDTDELESLVMSVMKHELQAVINLGALIGAVIGVINIFI